MRTINDYYSEKELFLLNKEFEKFKKSKFLQNVCEIKIFKNRWMQNFKYLLSDSKIIFNVFSNYLKKFSGKSLTLRSMEIALTYKCNANCDQCSCRLSYDPKRKRLTLDEFKKVIDDCIEMGSFQFNITGGEPLLYEEELIELLKYIKNKKKFSHLCSNGYLMTKEKLKKFVDCGLNSLEIGIDSAFLKDHEDNRNIETFKKILEISDYVKKFKIPIILNTIITHEKIKNYDMLALTKLTKMKNVILQITLPCVTGAWKNKLDILLDDNELLYLRWLQQKFSHIRMDTYSSFIGRRCPAGREKLGINPYGDVMSCPLIQITYGNFKEESIRKIQKRILENPFYHKKTKDGCLPSIDREFIEKYMLDKNEKRL